MSSVAASYFLHLCMYLDYNIWIVILHTVTVNQCYYNVLIIYKERFLDCDWSILVQLILNRGAKICVTTVQKSVTTEEPIK